jgi:hypothetical protein
VNLEADSLVDLEVASTTSSLEPNHPLVSHALFAKDLCNFLVYLEAANPGFDKEIVYLLSRKGTTGGVGQEGEGMFQK